MSLYPKIPMFIPTLRWTTSRTVVLASGMIQPGYSRPTS
jgi:hypothetical protein